MKKLSSALRWFGARVAISFWCMAFIAITTKSHDEFGILIYGSVLGFTAVPAIKIIVKTISISLRVP